MGSACGAASGGPIRSFFNAVIRFCRVPVTLGALAVLIGCAPTRPGATLDAIAPLRPGLARVVVLRDKAFGQIADAGFQAYLDEAPLGDLKTGTFVFRDIPAGQHKLFFSRPLELYRASQKEFSAAPGHIYHFRLEANDKGNWILAGAVLGGVVGLAATSAITAAADERGLFDFTQLDDAAASAAMAELRLAE
jgi:hypothetical protein